KIDEREPRYLGSARALACCVGRLAQRSSTNQEVFGGAPKTAREARALPGKSHDERSSIRETSRASPRGSLGEGRGCGSWCRCCRWPDSAEARLLWPARR